MTDPSRDPSPAKLHIDGACHCGAIAYEAEVDPTTVRICHCTDCQTLSGSAYRVSVPAAKSDFRVIRGELRIYVKIADSGARRAQGFCAQCGTPIYSSPAQDPEFFILRIGAVRQRSLLVPSRQIWCQSAAPWAMDLRAVPAVPRD